MTDKVKLDVGGTVFTINKKLLQKYPDTLLGSLSDSSEYFSKEDDIFYFDRNPELFNTILDYYRNDEIHLPLNFCGWLWKIELTFWKIPYSKIRECCVPKFSKYDEEEAVSAELRAVFAPPLRPPLESWSNFQRARHKIWLFLDEPLSSYSARVFSIVYLAVTVVSSILPCLFTHPDVRVQTSNVTVVKWYAYFNDIDLWWNFNNPKEVMFATTDIPASVYRLDIVLSIFFTIETVARFITCPSKCHFFHNLLNVLDVILIFGMWAHIILLTWIDDDKFLKNKSFTYFICFCEAISVFRLFRFFRLAKQFSSLQILFLALRASVKELLLLVVTFLVLGWVFACLIYYMEILEPDTFPNMLVGLWWAVVTMTTVGYGDMYPVGALGRVVGALCAMCGLLVLAMPIAVIAGNFSDLYRKNDDREHYNELQENHKSICDNFGNSVAPTPNDSMDFDKLCLSDVKK